MNKILQASGSKEVFISVNKAKEEEVDHIVVNGWFTNADFFPHERVMHVGFSDGTLIRYDQRDENRIVVLNKGSAYKRKETDEYGDIFVMDQAGLSWVVCGEYT